MVATNNQQHREIEIVGFTRAKRDGIHKHCNPYKLDGRISLRANNVVHLSLVDGAVVADMVKDMVKDMVRTWLRTCRPVHIVPGYANTARAPKG